MRKDYLIIPGEKGWSSYVRTSKLEEIGSVDAIIFDCDGVLIDARDSYDAAIVKTVDRILREVFGVRLPWRSLAPSLVQRLRQTGGFNNDWDTTYAIIAFTLLSSSPSSKRATRGAISEKERDGITKRVVEYVEAFASSGKTLGYPSVEAFLRSRLSSRYNSFAQRLGSVGYPGKPPESLLAAIFDEAYLGPRLYRRVYDTTPKFGYRRGLIDRERLLLSTSDLDRMTKLVGGSLSILTGRPYLATKYSMGPIFDYFDQKASFFTGDFSDPSLAKFRKPNAAGLLQVRDRLSSRMPLYVGDSGEDAMMVENARMMKKKFLFAGVYGTSFDRRKQLEFFMSSRADLILPSARSITGLIESVRKADL